MLKENEELDLFQYATYHIGMRLTLSQLTNEMLEDVLETSKMILDLRKGKKKNVSKTNSKSK